MALLDILPDQAGQSPEAPGSLVFYKQGADPSSGVKFTTEGMVSSAQGGLGETLPVNHGISAWTYDPSLAVNSSLLVNGTMYLSKLHIPDTVAATKLYWWVSAVAVTPTAGQNWVGLYDANGNRLAQTNVDADTTSVGPKTTTIAAQTLTSGSFVWVAMLFNAATAPTVSRATGNAGVAAAANLNLVSSTYRYATNGTGQTTMPATIVPGNNVAGGFAGPWAGIGA